MNDLGKRQTHAQLRNRKRTFNSSCLPIVWSLFLLIMTFKNLCGANRAATREQFSESQATSLSPEPPIEGGLSSAGTGLVIRLDVYSVV